MKFFKLTAVRIYFLEMSVPPHQNSVPLGPWRKMAAIQGQFPGTDLDPPTIRKLGLSICPHISASLSDWLNPEPG